MIAIPILVASLLILLLVWAWIKEYEIAEYLSERTGYSEDQYQYGYSDAWCDFAEEYGLDDDDCELAEVIALFPDPEPA